jgi:hypothetical protein
MSGCLFLADSNALKSILKMLKEVVYKLLCYKNKNISLYKKID